MNQKQQNSGWGSSGGQFGYNNNYSGNQGYNNGGFSNQGYNSQGFNQREFSNNNYGGFNSNPQPPIPFNSGNINQTIASGQKFAGESKKIVEKLKKEHLKAV